VKRLAKVFALVLIGLLLITSVVYAAIASPAPYAVYQTNAYQNCLEAGDQMYIIVGVIEYGTNPPEDAGEAFIVRLLDADNATELNAVAPYPDVHDSGYDAFCVGIYFTAAEVATKGMAWGGTDNFTVELTGNPALVWDAGDPPIVTNNNIAAWNDASYMISRVRAIALDLEADWGITLTQQSGGVTQLNSDGADYFEHSIAGLRAICPGLFSATVVVPEFEERAYTQAEATSTEGRWIRPTRSLSVDAMAGVTLDDIGTAVVGTVSGHTGILENYSTDLLTLRVITTDNFAAIENITVDGVLCGATTGAAANVSHMLDLTEVALDWGVSRMWATSVVWVVMSLFIVGFASVRLQSYRMGAFILASLLAVGAFIGAMPFVVAPIMGFLAVAAFVYTIAWSGGQ